MSVNVLPAVIKPAFWQVAFGLFMIRYIWLVMAHPFLRWAGGRLAWFVMWELSALGCIDGTTEQCSRKNGGTLERQPGRLAYQDWLIHRGCVGREAGYEQSILGKLIFLALVVFIIASVGAILAILKYVPRCKPYYQRVRVIISFLVGVISLLARIISLLIHLFYHLLELFVVTKPVELNKESPIDTPSYKLLARAKDQMEAKLHEYEARLAVLETIANWCQSEHATPDAHTMKVQQHELATTKQQLERLRREYIYLQNHCRWLEDMKDDLKLADVSALRSTIDSKESDIRILRQTINALEARPDTLSLKAERVKVQELQQKLDAQIQEATAIGIKDGLLKEEIAKLETSNKSLQLALKAAEERAQVTAASHDKAMDEMKEKVTDLEATILSMGRQLGQAQEKDTARSSADDTIEKLRQQLKATKARYRKQLDSEILDAREELAKVAEAEVDARVAAARAELAKTSEAEIDARVAAARAELAKTSEAEIDARAEAAREELAKATEAEVNSRIIAARKELAEAAEAEINARNAAARRELMEAAESEINSRILAARQELARAAETELSARVMAARKELADAAEAEIESRVQQRLMSAPAAAAVPAPAPAPAPAQTPTLTPAPAPAAIPISSTSAPVAVAAEPVPAAASSPPRKRATGRRIKVNPDMGNQYHPQHVVAHARAQAEAAAFAAFEAGKFFEETIDVNKPFQGKRERVEYPDDEDSFNDVYMK